MIAVGIELDGGREGGNGSRFEDITALGNIYQQGKFHVTTGGHVSDAAWCIIDL